MNVKFLHTWDVRNMWASRQKAFKLAIFPAKNTKTDYQIIGLIKLNNQLKGLNIKLYIIQQTSWNYIKQ